MNKIVLFGIIFFLSIVSASAVQLSQLTYHHMGNDAVSEYVTKASFTAQMQWLYDNGFKSCSFAGFMNNTCKDKSFILVFDDNNIEALTMFKPIMDKYGFKGTVGVVPIWVGKSGKLSWDNIETLYINGWEIASHSQDHTDFVSSVNGKWVWMSTAAQQKEYYNSKYNIYDNTGITANYFIYPYNDADENTRTICMKYYKGCTAGSSYTTSSKDLYLKTGMDLINTGLVRVKVENTMDMTRFQRIFNYVILTNTTNATTNITTNITSNNTNITTNVSTNISTNITTNITTNMTTNITSNNTNITNNMTTNITTNVTENISTNITMNTTTNVTLNITGNETMNQTLNISDNSTINDSLNYTMNTTGNLTINDTGNITMNVSENLTMNDSGNLTINTTINESLNMTLNTTINTTINITTNTTGNITLPIDPPNISTCLLNDSYYLTMDACFASGGSWTVTWVNRTTYYYSCNTITQGNTS